MDSNFEARVFTLEELSTYDGTNGKPAYVAVNGNVYDMSNVMAWKEGNHYGQLAGKDLSREFKKCHYGMVQILNTLPQVGVLKP